MINKSVSLCTAILIALVANRFRAHKKEYGIPVWRWQVCYSFRFPDSLMFPSQRASLRPGYSHREAFELSKLCNNTWGGSWLTGGREREEVGEREREYESEQRRSRLRHVFGLTRELPDVLTRTRGTTHASNRNHLACLWMRERTSLALSLSLYLCGTGTARRAL